MDRDRALQELQPVLGHLLDAVYEANRSVPAVAAALSVPLSQNLRAHVMHEAICGRLSAAIPHSGRFTVRLSGSGSERSLIAVDGGRIVVAVKKLSHDQRVAARNHTRVEQLFLGELPDQMSLLENVETHLVLGYGLGADEDLNGVYLVRYVDGFPDWTVDLAHSAEMADVHEIRPAAVAPAPPRVAPAIAPKRVVDKPTEG